VQWIGGILRHFPAFSAHQHFPIGRCSAIRPASDNTSRWVANASVNGWE
jgi:hypothetical protein